MPAPWGGRRMWRLLGYTHDYLIVPGGEVRPEEQSREVPGHFLVDRWMRDSSTYRVMVELYEWLGGWSPSGLTVFQRQEADERLRQKLAEAFQCGRLVVLREEHARGYLPPTEKKPTPAPQELRPTTWISLRLKDEDGAPVSGQRCRLRLSDGSFREGVSRSDGVIHFEGIPEGSCEVEFPGVDGADWRPA